jgi:hypothetical protein
MVRRFDSIADQIIQDSDGSGDDDGFEGETVVQMMKMSMIVTTITITKMMMKTKKMTRMKI